MLKLLTEINANLLKIQKATSRKSLDDLIEYDDLKKKLKVSERSFQREKTLRVVQPRKFAGREFYFISEIIDLISGRISTRNGKAT